MVCLLEELYVPSAPATAFIKERGLLGNARPHVKKALVFNLDLKDFYNSIHFGRVVGLLRSPPYNLREDTSRYIATLCCYNKALPQGAPTSPILSNMAAKKLDRRLAVLARDNLAYYTRYADDITFSFRNLNHDGICIEHNGDYFPSKKLIEIISKCRFTINDSKTRGATANARQVVTGLKVNQKINVDRRYIRATKAMIHSISIDEHAANQRYWAQNAESLTKLPELKDVVAGRISYIGMVKGVDSSVYEMLAYKFNSLPIDMKLAFDHSLPNVVGKKSSKLSGSEKYLSNCMWLISFEGIPNATLDDELVQGSAFMISGQRIITCAHTFEKASNLSQCFIYQAHDHNKKFKMKIKNICRHRDYVELEFLSKPAEKFISLKLYRDQGLRAGYNLTLVGFPEYFDSQKNANIVDVKVVNVQFKSTIYRYEVDAEILAGFSGGAVVNRYCQVVGMVTHGRTVASNDDGSFRIEGKSLFLGAESFL